MIKSVFFTSPSGKLYGFSINGHADAGDEGNDIVCAAVSSSAYMVANTISDIMHIQSDICVNENGFMKVLISEKDISRSQDILQGLKLHLLSLEEQYPKNIIVNYLEV